MRKSGKVDIYWNCKVVDSTTEGKHQSAYLIYLIVFEDVDINFNDIYLKKADGTYYKIDTKWDIRVGMDTAVKEDMTSRQWDQIFYKKICNNVAFFSSYILINTSFFISH